MSIYFAGQSRPKLQKAIDTNALIILPVGQVEEHDKHLPVPADTAIVQSTAQRLAEALADEDIPTLVMPAVWSDYSTKDMIRWPGTMRIRPSIHRPDL